MAVQCSPRHQTTELILGHYFHTFYNQHFITSNLLFARQPIIGSYVGYDYTVCKGSWVMCTASNKFKYTGFRTDHLARYLLTTKLLNYNAKEKTVKKNKNRFYSRANAVVVLRLQVTFWIAIYLQHHVSRYFVHEYKLFEPHRLDYLWSIFLNIFLSLS